MKESRKVKTDRRINYAKAQLAEYDAILKSDNVKQWPEFAKEPYRRKVKMLKEEIRKLEARNQFFVKLKEGA